MKKLRKTCIMSILLLCFVLAGCFMATECHAASLFEIHPSTQSNYHVKITWAKKSVTKYRVYRATVSSSGKVGKYKRIATISGKKTSYTDTKVSKKKTYSYKIRGYKKNKLKYESWEEQAYTGVGDAIWGEYATTDGDYSTELIELYNGIIWDGMTPDGIKIYRRVHGTKTYKLIKTISTHKRSFSYKDKTVSAGKCYDYRFRAYKKITYKKKKTTIYGAYSKALTKSAVNNGGKFTVDFAAPSANDANSIEITLTSQKYNGVLQLPNSLEPDYEEVYDESKDLDYTWLKNLTLTKYSYDGTSWKSYNADKAPTLTVGKTIHLLYTVETTEADAEIKDFASHVESISFNTFYEGIPYIMTIKPSKTSAEMEINSEYIHD